MNLKTFLTETLHKMESQSELKKLIGFDETLSRLRQRLNDDYFRIAVTGEFSSGKSTFINALIGKDILSHATTETTAALSRLINVSETDARNGTGCAYMKDGSIVDIPKLSEIKEFTTTQSTKYNVAQDVEYVEIYVPLLQSNRALAIVDTPGLNGMAEGHFEQTTAMIQAAHACIYIISRRGLTNTDVKFLNEYLVPYQRNFIFVQNFLDEFNESEGETVEDKIKDAKKILLEQVFNDKGAEEYFFEICCVSSLRELVGRDTEIDRLYLNDTTVLTADRRKRLLETSGFDELRGILDRNFNQEELDKIKFTGMLASMLGWCEQLLERIEKQHHQADEMYKLSSEYKASLDLDKLRDKVIRSKSGDAEALKGFISRQCSELKKQLKEALQARVNDLAERLKNPIGNFNNVDELDRYGKELNGRIRQQMFAIQTEMGEYCTGKLNEIYRLIIERLEEYGGSINPNVGASDLMLKLPERISQDYVSSNKISSLNRQINDLSSELSSQQYWRSEAQRKASNKQSDVNSLRYQRQNADNERQRLGSRPRPTTYRQSYEVKVESSGVFGWFRKKLFGPKYETRYRDVQDDSAGQRWDRDVKAIEDKRDRIVRELNAAERELRRLQSDADDYGSYIRSTENKIERLRHDLRLEQESAETAKRLAREKHLKMCKNQMRSDIEKYFGDADEGELQRLNEQWANAIDSARSGLQEKSLLHFETIFKNKLQDIEACRQTGDTKLQTRVGALENARATLEEVIGELKTTEEAMQ